MASKIKNFTSKGGTTPFRQKPVFPNNGGEPQPIRARLSQSGGIKGSRVKVTNPKASFRAGRVRHGSIGQGGAGQETSF